MKARTRVLVAVTVIAVGSVVFGVTALCQVGRAVKELSVGVDHDETGAPIAWHYSVESTHFVSVFDNDSDGEPDEVWLYEVGAQRNLEVTFLEDDGMRLAYNDCDGRLIRREDNVTSSHIQGSEDWPDDARWQIVHYYREIGHPTRSESFYPSGFSMRRASYDGAGHRVLEEFCNPSTGAVRYRVLYEEGVARVREADTDGNGRMDEIQRFDETGTLIAEEYDRDGDGWLDEKREVEPGS
jgi:hypothetical protein